MVTLRQLRYLSALAKHGHFGRAAEDCAVTQPALSMQIRDLERTLGLALVERRPGEVTLTEAGLEISRRGDEVLAKSRDLMDFARQRARPLAGRLTLGLIPSLAPYALPKILPNLQSRFPELRLELRETQTRQLLDEVKSGALDVAMLALPIHETDLATMPPLGAATAAPTNSGPIRLKKEAKMIACSGRAARVATRVAIAFAAS